MSFHIDGERFIDLSFLNISLVNLSAQDFVYSAILPMISLIWAFYMLLGHIRIFRSSKISRMLIAGVFAFIATFFFRFGYFGFWVGMMAVVIFGVRGTFWKGVGLVALFLLLTFPLPLLTPGGIVSAIGGFLILLVLTKVRSNVMKIVFLGIIIAMIWLGSTFKLPEPQLTYPGIPL